MKYTIQALLAIALMHTSFAQGKISKIIGTWSSDRLATKEYLIKNAILDEYQKKVLPLLFGNMDVTYREDGTGTTILKASRIPKKDGGEIVTEQTSIEFKFEIIGESGSQVVIKVTSGEFLFPAYPFSLIRFHDADTCSVALSDGIVDMNGREFFKRIKK